MSGGVESVGRCMGVQRNQEAPRGGRQPGGLPGNGRSWSRRRTGAALGGRPTGGWQTAAVVAVYFTRPGRWVSSPGGQDGLDDDDLEGSDHRLACRVERRLDIDRVSARRQVDLIGVPLDENRVTGARTVKTGNPLGLLHERGLTGRADAHGKAPARAEVTGRTIGAEPCHLGVRQLRPPLVLDHSGSSTNTDGDGSATETILSLSARFTAPAGSGVTETDGDGSATETILSLSAKFTAPAGSGVTETAPEDSATLSGSRLS